MKRHGVPVLLLSLLFLTPAYAELKAAKSGGVPGRYFVRLDDGQARWGYEEVSVGLSVSEVSAALTTQYGGQATAVFDGCIKGFVFLGTSRDASRVAGDFRVVSVAQDTAVIPEDKGCILACPSHPEYDPAWQPELQPVTGISSPQPIACLDPEPSSGSCTGNWGLDRIDERPLLRDGEYVFDNEGQNTHVYVVDTGIFATHPEFRVETSPVFRVLAGRNVYADVTGTGDPLDVSDAICSRHGTSVASVIAGRTFGVAKGALVHPVRFTNSDGVSPITAWIAALDWVASNFQSPAVINISSNGLLSGAPAFPDLISCAQAVLALNIPIVEAAGNRNNVDGDACAWTLADPAVGAPGLLVAGGIDQFDTRWERDSADPDEYLCPFGLSGDCASNTGSCVDLWAPAAHIVSAHGYPSGDPDFQSVCHSSGTSFAAPHVTGAVALYLTDHPGATVSEVTEALRGSAWAGVLDSSIADPNPGGPSSNNLLVDSTLNLRPIANDDYTTALGAQTVISWSSLLANDEDPEAGPLEVCAVGTPALGTIVSSGGGFTTYAPPPPCFAGQDSFDYTICDDGGGQDIGTVIIDGTCQ